jgi:VanZ family protein
MIKELENNRRFAIIFTLIIAAEIFIFSSFPGTKVEMGGLDLTSLYHLIVFFLLNFFLLISLIGKKKIKTKYLFITIITSIIYAFLDEIHQIFVAFRTPSIGDILTDSVGILLSTLIYINYKKRENYK